MTIDSDECTPQSTPLDLYLCNEEGKYEREHLSMADAVLLLEGIPGPFAFSDPSASSADQRPATSSALILVAQGYTNIDILRGALRDTNVEHVVFDDYLRTLVLSVNPQDEQLLDFMAAVKSALPNVHFTDRLMTVYGKEAPVDNLDYSAGGPLDVGAALGWLEVYGPRTAPADIAPACAVPWLPVVPAKGPIPHPRVANAQTHRSKLNLDAVLVLPRITDPLNPQLHQTRPRALVGCERLHILEFVHNCFCFAEEGLLSNAQIKQVYTQWSQKSGVSPMKWRYALPWLRALRSLGKTPTLVKPTQVRHDKNKTEAGLKHLVVRREWAHALP